MALSLSTLLCSLWRLGTTITAVLLQRKCWVCERRSWLASAGVPPVAGGMPGGHWNGGQGFAAPNWNGGFGNGLIPGPANALPPQSDEYYPDAPEPPPMSDRDFFYSQFSLRDKAILGKETVKQKGPTTRGRTYVIGPDFCSPLVRVAQPAVSI